MIQMIELVEKDKKTQMGRLKIHWALVDYGEGSCLSGRESASQLSLGSVRPNISQKHDQILS